MIDYYLKFESEEQASEMLADFEGSIDVIGVIYKPTGKMIKSAEGDYSAMAAIPGWHVNVRLVEGEDADALEPFEVTPITPIRVWG